jgi:hypothetical protein
MYIQYIRENIEPLYESIFFILLLLIIVIIIINSANISFRFGLNFLNTRDFEV